MSTDYRLFSHTKQQYQQLFQNLQRSLRERLEALKSEFFCVDASGNRQSFTHSVSAEADCCGSGCGFHPWRETVLAIVEQEIPRDITAQLNAIQNYRQQVSCHMCGQCCRLASSEDDYDTLLAKAASGDAFAREFTSVFLPYASREAAIERDAAGVDAVLDFYGETPSAPGDSEGAEKRVHFYFCPYIQEDNRCGLYGSEKRPSICATYPETPLGYVAKACAWSEWQEDTHLDTLMAHAMLNLCEDWSKRLHQPK